MIARLHVKRTLNRVADAVWRVRHFADSEAVRKAEAAARVMRQLVPVRTGALLRSIEATKLARGVAMVAAGGPSAPYVRAVEYGTTFQDAQPFFTPAVRSVSRSARVRRMRA